MQPVRPLDSASHGNTPRPVATRWLGLIALFVAGSVFAWPSSGVIESQLEAPSDFAPTSADEGNYGSPAATSFAEFVAAINRRQPANVQALLAPRLPDVAGLGTIAYPRLPPDDGLWRDGRLEPARIATFLDAVAGLRGELWISDCTDFADGPVVVIASCRFEANRGFSTDLGLSEQQGTLFGFMVDGKVAGVVARG